MAVPKRDDAGSYAVELLVVATLLALMMMIVGAAALWVESKHDVSTAAAEAARAASLERDETAANEAGHDAARDALKQRGESCAELSVNVDISSYEPGGQVSATVRCVADTSSLSLLNMTSETFEATSIAPIEQYREG